MLPKVLVGARSCWRSGACVRLCIANRRRETAPTRTVRCGGRSFFLPRQPATILNVICLVDVLTSPNPQEEVTGRGSVPPRHSHAERGNERTRGNEMDERGATCPPLAVVQGGVRPEIGCRTKSHSAFKKSPAIRGHVNKHKQLPVNAGCCPPCQV